MIDRLEKKFGRFAIKNLIYYVLGGYAVGYLLYILYARGISDIYALITLSPDKVMQGQVWRLFTWVITIPQALSLWVVFMFLFYFFIGRSLEQSMGAFRYNLYMFSGWLFMTVGAMAVYWITAASGTPISMNVSTYYINISIYIVFAMTYPNDIVRLYFVIPIKMKWLGIVDTIYLLYIFLVGYLPEKAAVVAALINCLIFYLTNIRGKTLNPYQIHRKNKFNRDYRKGFVNSGRTRNTGGVTSSTSDVRMNPRPQTRHKCAICGKTEVSDPDMEFRYCSKCAGSYEYCSTHLFTHTHVRG